MFSASIDYTVVQWSPAGTPFNTIDVSLVSYGTLDYPTPPHLDLILVWVLHDEHASKLEILR